MELEPPPSYNSVCGSVNDAGCHLSGKIPEMKMDTPAAPVLSSEQQQNNVVILNQPTTAETRQVIVHQSPPRDYVLLTSIMMVLCGLSGNLLAFVCLIPAICFAVYASNYKKAGDFISANSYGKVALCLNILAIVFFVILVTGVVIIIIVVLVSLSSLADLNSSSY